MQHILQHFQTVDPKLAQVFKHVEITPLVHNTNTQEYFQRLCESIISQQLSVKVADVIEARFHALFPSELVQPQQVIEIEDQKLRDIGISWSKIKYLNDLADKSLSGEIHFEKFAELDDEAVILELTPVKGIGRWTAEMFLIFTLGRPDVFSKGDLGLKRAMQKIYGLTQAEVEERADELTAPWAPYRSYASKALWRSLDNE